jgi:hypothetical protein
MKADRHGDGDYCAGSPAAVRPGHGVRVGTFCIVLTQRQAPRPGGSGPASRWWFKPRSSCRDRSSSSLPGLEAQNQRPSGPRLTPRGETTRVRVEQIGAVNARRVVGLGGLDGYDGHVLHAGGERIHVVGIAGQEAYPCAQSRSRTGNDCIDGVVSPGLPE